MAQRDQGMDIGFATDNSVQKYLKKELISVFIDIHKILPRNVQDVMCLSHHRLDYEKLMDVKETDNIPLEVKEAADKLIDFIRGDLTDLCGEFAHLADELTRKMKSHLIS